MTGGDGRRMPSGFAPVVALLAVAGLVALPCDLAVNDGGGLDFAWRPSQTREDVLADPVVRVTVRPGSSPDGVGWIVGTCLEVTGDDAIRARWCEKRNAALRDVAGGPAASSGWAPASAGNCRLTTRFAPGDLAGQPLLAATLLADVLRAQQDAVLSAVLAAPETVANPPSHPPRARAAGLSRVATVFRSLLDYPPGYLASASAEEAGVVVTLEGFCADGLAVPLAETARRSFQTAVTVPACCNRAELGLVYAALLSHSSSRIPARHGYDLVPGEFASESFTDNDVQAALVLLSKADVARCTPPTSGDDLAFPAGPVRGRLSFPPVPMARLYDSAPLRISASASLPPGYLPPARDGSDTDVLGTWNRTGDTLSYSVLLPPTVAVWAWPAMAAEVLAWLGRHVVRQIQDAVLGAPLLLSRHPVKV